jgi:hypothetical protein
MGAVIGVYHYKLTSCLSLLKVLQKVHPGKRIELTKCELKINEMYKLEDYDKMVRYGKIKDMEFLENKKLYIFNYSGLPYRFLEVYTDKDDVVQYVTWDNQ